MGSDGRPGTGGVGLSESCDLPKALRGGSPREGARSEVRAEQRLAAGGRRLPRPSRVRGPTRTTQRSDPYRVIMVTYPSEVAERRRAYLFFGLAALSLLMFSIDNTVVSVALPNMM